jgi:serine/threonine-protein kinase
MSDETADGSREGTDFGQYRLRRLLGRGGMGDVYEAEDTHRERIVALKLMSEALSRDPVFRKRMQREARTAGRLQEPHVVPIHDFGEIDGQLYVDMRMIEGSDVAKMISRYGPLSPPRAVAVVRQIGSALDAAHAAGILHRDVKPENILVAGDDFAYLVDFGIASANTDDKLTQLGTTVGTFKYMAPERFMDGDVGYRADIYALACVLYECLTGHPPYQGDQVSVMSAHINQPTPRPSAVRPGIPVALDRVIACGMAKNPADRYATCGDLANAAYAALASTDQNRATDILQRSQSASAPASFVGPPPSGFTPTPTPPHARPQGTGWPPPAATGSPSGPSGPSALQPTGWPGPPSGPTGGTPPWVAPMPHSSVGGLGKPLLWVGLAAAIVVVAVVGAVIGLHPWTSSSPASPGSPSPAADAVELRVLDDGVYLGSSVAPVTIDVFNEPICPPCASFVRSYEGDMYTAVTNKKLAVRYHLLNFLDGNSHSKSYSSRAVAASYCVASKSDPKLYSDFYAGLFADDFQPAEQAPEDRTDAELAQLAKKVGADTTVTGCIKSGDELNSARSKAAAAGQTLASLNASGTPLVWNDTGKKNVTFTDPRWLDRLIG